MATMAIKEQVRPASDRALTHSRDVIEVVGEAATMHASRAFWP